MPLCFVQFTENDQGRMTLATFGQEQKGLSDSKVQH